VVSCGVRDGAVPTCAVDVYGRVWLIRFVRQCVSLRLVSLSAESFRFVSIRVGRIVWIVHVVRVVSCRVHSYSYVLVRVCIRAVVLIVLRYVTSRSYVRYVFVSCVRYVYVHVHTA